MSHGPPTQAWPAEQVVLRPRSLLEIGDLASRFARQHAPALARVLPVCVLPAGVAWALHQRGVSAELCWTVAIALGPVTSAVATVLCGELMLQPQASARRALEVWARHLGRLLLVRAVDAAAKYPTFSLFFYWSAFFPEVVTLEDGGLSATTRRTPNLLGVVPGRWLGLLAMTVLVQVVGAWAGEVAWQALRWVLAMPNGNSALLEDGISAPALLGLTLGQVYVAIVRFLTYIDCRTRREGWDLAVQATGLVAAARAQASRSAA